MNRRSSRAKPRQPGVARPRPPKARASRKSAVDASVRTRSPGTRRSIALRNHHATRLGGIKPDPQHSWRHDNIGRLLIFAFHAFEERLLEAIRKAGFDSLKHVHFNLFRHVDFTGTRLVDLATRAGVTKAAMGQLARDCERLGFIRIETDPTDGRAKIVRFTARGKRLVATSRRQMRRLENGFRDVLGHRRYQALNDGLAELRARLSAQR